MCFFSFSLIHIISPLVLVQIFFNVFFTAVDCRRVATWLSSCAGRFEENKVGQRITFRVHLDHRESVEMCRLIWVASSLEFTNTQIGWHESTSMCRFLWLKSSLGHKVNVSFIPTTHASDVSNVSHKRLRWDKRFGFRDTINWSDDVAKLECFAFCKIPSLDFTKKMATPGD